jgi:Pentapeptide repeats (9 copies)
MPLSPPRTILTKPTASKPKISWRSQYLGVLVSPQLSNWGHLMLWTFQVRRHDRFPCLGLIRWAAILAFTFGSFAPPKVSAAAHTPPVVPNPVTPTEQYVLETVARGDVADLTNRTDRLLRPEVLAKLLWGSEKENPSGIHVVKAEIKDQKPPEGKRPFDVSNRDILLSFTCDNCDFDDSVDFSGSHFIREVAFVGSHFSEGLHLSGARFDGSLDLRNSRIRGALDFSGMQIAGDLNADGLHARDLDGPAQFDHVRVGAAATLTNIQITGDLTLQKADVAELDISSDPRSCPQRPEEPALGKNVDLDGLTVRRNITVEKMTLDSWSAANMQVLGWTTIRDVRICEYADLRGARLQYLVLAQPNVWPTSNPRKAQPALVLDGITFSQVDVQDAKGSEAVDADWKNLLDGWLDKGSFSTQPYQELENAFRSVGRPDLADQTFERMKDRERMSHRLGALDWLKSFLLSTLVRYGREPYRAFYYGVAIVMLGYFVFRDEKNMQPKQPQFANKPYDAFWYSFVLFLPLANVPDNDVWEPKDDKRGLQAYARIHSLLGWILVPIGLAAVSGLISSK